MLRMILPRYDKYLLRAQRPIYLVWVWRCFICHYWGHRWRGEWFPSRYTPDQIPCARCKRCGRVDYLRSGGKYGRGSDPMEVL